MLIFRNNYKLVQIMVESQRALRAQKEGSRHKQWLIGESDDHARRGLKHSCETGMRCRRNGRTAAAAEMIFGRRHSS